MRGVNLIAVFNKEQNKVLMCKRRKDPYKGLLNFVGGKIKDGEEHFASAYRELFEENINLITKECSDLTGDGRFNVELMEISFSEQLGYADKSNSTQKMTNAIGMGTARLYIMDKSHVLSNKDKGVFADVSHFGEGIVNTNGETVAVSLKGNKILDKLGIDSTEELYLALRIVSEVDAVMDKGILKKDEAVRKMAEAILN